MKKTVALLLALMLTISLSAIAVAEDKPVITIAVQDTTNVEDFNTNVTTLMLEEALGVDIQFDVYPATDYNVKINTMVMAGGADLPDVVFVTPSDAQLLNWIESKVIIPLNQYYEDETISPNIHDAIKRTGTNFTQMMVQYDGNIYAIPVFNQSYGNEYPHKAFYNQKWLDALGAEAPTTPDELYDLLVKVKNTDLNGNGKQDEYGFSGVLSNAGYSGWFTYVMNAFVYADQANGYLNVQDGVVSASYATEAWKDGLKFLRKLFAEDLLPKETLTQDDKQYLTMLNSEDCTTLAIIYMSTSRVNASLSWRNDFVAKAPLINRETGKPLSSYRPSAPNNGSFFITKNCENPELAFRIGDLMVSQLYSIMTRWGQEGVDWDYVWNIADSDKMVPTVDGFPKLFKAYDDPKFWSSGEMQNRSFIQKGPYIREYGIANGVAVDPATVTEYTKNLNAALALYQTNNYRPEEVTGKLVYSEEEIEVVADVKTTLDTYRDEWTANALAGNFDIDAEWDNYLNELKNIGLDEYIEVVQGVYDRMYK